MDLMEESIKEFSANSLKKWLKKFANNPLKAFLSGSTLWAILQSSAVSILIIMAFAAAWYLTLPSAIWATMGANVWSTLLGILVVYIWFSFNIASLSLAVIAIGWIIFKFFSSQKRKILGKLLFSFGLLFYGISILKEAVGVFTGGIDLAMFSHVPLIWRFFIGIVLTALLQSSWAMSIITLWALHGWLLTFPQSVAIIAGANIGTCVTPFRAAIKWASEKKQVAVSHIVYNIFASTLVMIFIMPLSDAMQRIYNFAIPWSQETALAMYQLIYNIIASIFFFPLIKPLATFLEKLFPDKKTDYVLWIDKIGLTEVDIAIPVIRDDAIMLLKKIFKFNVHHLKIDQKALLDDNIPMEKKIEMEYVLDNQKLTEDYTTCKIIEEDILIYILKIMGDSSISWWNLGKLQNIHYGIERMMYAAKVWKDIHHALHILFATDNIFIVERLQELKKNMVWLYYSISEIIDNNDVKNNYVLVENTTELLKEDNKKFIKEISEYLDKNELEEWLLSELFHLSQAYERSNESIVDAIEALFVKHDDDKQ